MQRAFTFRANGIARVLKTPAGVCLPYIPEEQAQEFQPSVKQYTAIWDTGATNSVITKKVVDDLQLKPINVTEIHHAGGTSMSNVYLVNIILPDGVMVPNVRVTLAELTDLNIPEEHQSHVLIGMDIITTGDFAVTNHNNKTVLSFRIPTSNEIDFVPEAKEHNIMLTGNRQERRAFVSNKRKGRF